MSDDKPSIAELQAAAKRRMETTTLDDYDRTGRDLLGATPVLLEIAAAALALRDQERVAAKARNRVYSTLNKNAVPSDENYAASDEEDRKLSRCREAYAAALAKVRR